MNRRFSIYYFFVFVLLSPPMFAQERSRDVEEEPNGGCRKTKNARQNRRVVPINSLSASKSTTSNEGRRNRRDPTWIAANEEAQYLELSARKELLLGLQFYKEFDDYRAIGSLKAYRILHGSAYGNYLSNLLIGHIYHRNAKPELAVRAYEFAFQNAPDTYAKTFTYLLANQESCVALDFYFDCDARLRGLKKLKLDPVTRDLVAYQQLYVDLVLRRPITAKRANEIQTPILKKKVSSLLIQDQAFHELKLRNPVISGVLSGVLPGAGQLYNGRPWDAFLALVFTSAFAGASYYSYVELENISLTVLSSALFLGFYLGNISNAVSDSQRINAKLYSTFFENLKRSHWARVRFEINEDKVNFGYRFDWPGPRKMVLKEEKP